MPLEQQAGTLEADNWKIVHYPMLADHLFWVLVERQSGRQKKNRAIRQRDSFEKYRQIRYEIC
jgi:hypothetical protein